MRQKFQFPILAVILVSVWPSLAQARLTDESNVGDDAAANFEQLRILAENGNQDAQYQLAEEYRMGSTVEQNHERAVELYNLSAAQGFAASQFRLGELYEEGEILDRNLGKAIEFYREAAEQGHPGAQYALALTYQLGSGIEQDIATAMDWYRKAAQQGHESSQLALGDQYRMGLTVPRDLAKSTEWYRRAANQGNRFAQYELGNAYRYGNGVERDIGQAIEWYRLSAEAGSPSAKLVLAELEVGDTATVIAAVPEPKASQDADSDVLASASETDLAVSETAMRTVAEEEAATPRPEPQDMAQSVSSAPRSDIAALDTESAYAATPLLDDRETVSRLLARAEDQVAKLAAPSPEILADFRVLVEAFRPSTQ